MSPGVVREVVLRPLADGLLARAERLRRAGTCRLRNPTRAPRPGGIDWRRSFQGPQRVLVGDLQLAAQLHLVGEELPVSAEQLQALRLVPELHLGKGAHLDAILALAREEFLLLRRF